MPLVRAETPPERVPSGNVRPVHIATYSECILRINRLASDLHVRETGSGTPHWDAASITTGMTCSEIANDIIVLAQALIARLDESYPQTMHPRHKPYLESVLQP